MDGGTDDYENLVKVSPELKMLGFKRCKMRGMMTIDTYRQLDFLEENGQTKRRSLY